MSKLIYKGNTYLTEFCGPNYLIKRKCIQLDKINSGFELKSIQLTYYDVKELIPELQKWIDNYDSTTN